MNEAGDPEFQALAACIEAIKALPTDEERERVMRYLANRFLPAGALAPTKYIGHAGGHARAAALSPERRSEIAKSAADARWRAPADRTEGR